jgi:hypothetical protein
MCVDSWCCGGSDRTNPEKLMSCGKADGERAKAGVLARVVLLFEIFSVSFQTTSSCALLIALLSF